MLKFTEEARSHIQDSLRKYSRIVAQARQRGMNEQDTADIVKAMLGDMLGYDPFFDVTAEVSVRGPHADYAVQIEDQLRFLLIVKPINVVPNAAHLVRLSGAATPPYTQWLLISNADVWACYRLGVGVNRHAELVLRTSLLDTVPAEEKAALFFILTKEAVLQDSLSVYWEQTRVLHPGRLASLILSEEVLNHLRREIFRLANYRIDRQTLYAYLSNEVLRPEALTGDWNRTPRPPQCYAYVPDPGNAQTWRLLYRNPDGTPDAELLMRAASEINHDIRALGIPADDVPLVKERLRNAFLELGVTLTDLPESLRH